MFSMTGQVIAIDGPSASGKSTVARAVAKELGYLYVDSGAVYRGVTWKALEKNVASDDQGALLELTDRLNMEFVVIDNAVRFRIDDVEPGLALRSREVDANVSLVAAVPGVRAQVVSWLRDMAKLGNLVVEGRDIGTAVFPDAAHKFYIDASPEERARRRFTEIQEREESVTHDEVDSALKRRDKVDSSREKDPLRVADGAQVVDTTGMGIEDVRDAILARLKRAG